MRPWEEVGSLFGLLDQVFFHKLVFYLGISDFSSFIHLRELTYSSVSDPAAINNMKEIWKKGR
jgi:hypothetical protein